MGFLFEVVTSNSEIEVNLKWYAKKMYNVPVRHSLSIFFCLLVPCLVQEMPAALEE